MFKLIKIEGSGSNQPEPIRMKCCDGVNYKTNHAYKLCDGSLAEAEDVAAPTHIAIETLKAGEKSTVLAFRIQDNMVFEAPVYGNINNFYVGCNYTLQVDSEGGAYGLYSSVNGGSVKIDDLNGAKQDGDKVYCRVTTEPNY